MRTKIKVTDLDLSQWDYIQTHLERAYRFAPGMPRVCVEFELTGQLDPVHVEMPVREFMLFVEELNAQRRHEIPEFPADAQEGHDHKRPVSLKTSQWPGCPPVRMYADGCQGYGPYGDESPSHTNRVEARPVLPTVEQVRDLSAKDAAELARQMNAPKPVNREDIVPCPDGIPGCEVIHTREQG